jgi:uncharacterized protein YigA (DUF484 family)
MNESDDTDSQLNHLGHDEALSDREYSKIELTLVKDELEADVKNMIRLHELSTRLLASTELQPLLEEILDATIELLNADFGNVQLFNQQSKALEIVAQRGFKQDFLDHFSNVKRRKRSLWSCNEPGRA